MKCDSCQEESYYILTMTDSNSMDNLFYSCRQCAADTMEDWMWTDIYRDINGWELRKI